MVIRSCDVATARRSVSSLCPRCRRQPTPKKPPQDKGTVVHATLLWVRNRRTKETRSSTWKASAAPGRVPTLRATIYPVGLSYTSPCFLTLKSQ
ncbi:unnamed protein product, partial [Ectocarpus sp. 12 AP-2014]